MVVKTVSCIAVGFPVAPVNGVNSAWIARPEFASAASRSDHARADSPIL